MNQAILMAHVFFGVVCLLAAVWIFVDVLQASETNRVRIINIARLAAGAMWLAFLAGGYWYVVFYKADKAIIIKGPSQAAHNFFMETKEHLVIILLLLANYLPITTANHLATNPGARRLALWVSGLTALLALLMEGEGALIAMGVKAGLLSR